MPEREKGRAGATGSEEKWGLQTQKIKRDYRLIGNYRLERKKGHYRPERKENGKRDLQVQKRKGRYWLER